MNKLPSEDRAVAPNPSRRRLLQAAALAFPLSTAAGAIEFLESTAQAEIGDNDAMLHLGAREAVTHIQEGNMSAEAYVTRLFSHYAEHTGLNTVVSVDRERVIEEARGIDRARTKGMKSGTLAGLPVMVKDQADVAGYPTTAGNGALKNNVAKKNAAVVETLVQNGALMFAKANCAVVAGAIAGTGATSTNPYFGFVHNPYDMARIPGGSSGGNAAALAARIVPAGIGADAGGSARGPASCCGVVGLRPSTYTAENFLDGSSRKRYSDAGELPPPQPVDTFGPMARTVADVAFLDSVITGETTPHVQIKGSRIGVPRDDYWDPDIVEPEVAKTVKAAFDRLRDAGAEIVEYDLKGLLALNQNDVLSRALRRPNRDFADWLAANLPHVTMEEVNQLRDSYPPACASDVTPMSDDQRTKIVAHAIQTYEQTFRNQGLAAIAFPTLPIRPPLINVNGDTPGQKILLNGKWVEEHASIAYYLVFAPALGAPSLSLPCGMIGGLPAGLSLQGLPGDDAKLLGLAIAVENVLGPVPPPPFLRNASWKAT